MSLMIVRQGHGWLQEMSFFNPCVNHGASFLDEERDLDKRLSWEIRAIEPRFDYEANHGQRLIGDVQCEIAVCGSSLR